VTRDEEAVPSLEALVQVTIRSDEDPSVLGRTGDEVPVAPHRGDEVQHVVAEESLDLRYGVHLQGLVLRVAVALQLRGSRYHALAVKSSRWAIRSWTRRYFLISVSGTVRG
jgi:hypothetical protein